MRFYWSILHLVLVNILISGSSAAYANGKSRYQEYRGCNGTVANPDISQEEESGPSEGTTSATSSVTSFPGGTTYPQNNYYPPVVLGPFGASGNRPQMISFGNNNRFSTGNRFGGGGSEFNEDRVPVVNTGSSRFDQFRQSVNAYRNQITGNRFFEMDGSAKFVLYTRKNPTTGHKIQLHNRDTVEGGDFNPELPTKLIIHGFSDIGALGEWVTSLRDSYLSTSEVNVIIADFSTFETFLMFWTNLPLFASKRISDLVTFLELTTGTSRSNFHLIARAWGTHVAGVTGRLLQGRIGRITGLEPEPRVYGSVLPDYRLISSDAQFVDIIRVNGRRYFFQGARFGLTPPTGHVDIYPHFSERSTGCPGTATNYGRNNFAYCHRGRGVTYFIDSIKNPKAHPICQCRSYTDYKSGSCTCTQENSNFYLGEHLSNQTRGVYQLAISSSVHQAKNFLRQMSLFGQ